LCGLVPMRVESLGGKFVHSDALSEEELAAADLVLLIHPDRPWPAETLERVWNYVRRGGSLLVAAEPVIRHGELASSFNEVLKPLAMKVRFDTAVARASNWEQSYEALAHPATSGIDDLRHRSGKGACACWATRRRFRTTCCRTHFRSWAGCWGIWRIARRVRSPGGGRR